MTSSVYRAMQLSAAVVATLAMPIARGVLTAQAPSTQTGSVAFEVVSIKRNTSAGPSRARLEPGRFTAVNAPVSQILRQAYDIQPFQLLNAPELGLKLEPARGPVTVLVIDHIERPSED